MINLELEVRGFENLDKEIQKLFKKINKAADKTLQEAPKKIAKEINKINRKTISYFYHAYSPRLYGRRYSLNRAWHITSQKGKIRIDFMSDGLSGHRVSNDYIYDWVFKQGYHGGAIDGKNHPSPGEPYYKVHPDYVLWAYPAVRTQSPFSMIKANIESSSGLFAQIVADTFIKNLK